ncbi:MAG: hypothetical protein ACU0DW_05880 [Shimia sp.]
MRRVCAMVHEVRCTRRGTLCFSNPRCTHCAAIVTEHERHFVQMFQNVRRGNLGAARASAMLLCEGNDDRRVLRAAEEVAELLPLAASFPDRTPNECAEPASGAAHS